MSIMNRLDAKVLSKAQVSSRHSVNRQAKEKLQTDRKNQRAFHFLASRGLEVPVENAIQTRTQKMEEYKQRKQQQKLEAQKKKLPPFRAGIVRHTLDSPYKYFDKKDAETTAPIPSKPFKFTLKPKLPAPKITIPYSPKFSRIRGHEVCHEIGNSAISSNATSRALSMRNQAGPSERPVNTRSNTPAPSRVTRQTTARNNPTKPIVNIRAEPSVSGKQTEATRRDSRETNRRGNVGRQTNGRDTVGHQTNNGRDTVGRQTNNGRDTVGHQTNDGRDTVGRQTNEISGEENKTRRNAERNVGYSNPKGRRIYFDEKEHASQDNRPSNSGSGSNNSGSGLKKVSVESNETKSIKCRTSNRISPPSTSVSIEKPSTSGIKRKTEVFHFTSKSVVKASEDLEKPDSNSVQNIFSFTGHTEETVVIENPVGNTGKSDEPNDFGKKANVDEKEFLDEGNLKGKSPQVDASPMDTDDLNSSIEIPEYFVKRKSSKASLRKKCLITPTKDPEPAILSLSGVEFQRRRLNEERNVLHRTCYLWQDKLTTSDDIPAEMRDDIYCMLCQTNLLTSDKFEQMARLIDQFENQEGQAEATGPSLLENDLDSFWDMMYIQVDLMYKKFDRLKRLERDGWVDREEEKREKENEKKKSKAGKLGSKPASGKVGAKSKIADFIRSKRNQVKSDLPADDTKEFNGGFFKVESPLSQKAKSKDVRPSFASPNLKKSILKNKTSCLNIIAVSPLAKSLAAAPLVDFVNTPSDQTRGILKKSNKSSMKSKHVTPGGKKICFSLSDPSQDEEIFSTPRESPRKAIRKTPHKSATPDPIENNNDTTLEIEPTIPESIENSSDMILEIEPATADLEKASFAIPDIVIDKVSPQRPRVEKNKVSSLTPQMDELSLPRKSPRVSKAPVRFSFTDFETKLVLDEEKSVTPRKTPRATPKRTPRNTSTSKRFVLRPSRLAVS